MALRAYWLVGVDGPGRKVKLPIKGPLLIGRGPYNHVVLKDPRISRQHARIAFEKEGCVVYDLGSANGTFVNGTRTTRHLLKLGDEVSLGTLTFRIAPGSQEIRLEPEALDAETPTLCDFGSISRMPVSSSDSSAQLPVVDLRELEDAYEKLGTLYSFMKAISQTIESKTLVELIASKTREIYQASNAVSIYLLSRDGGESTFKLAYAVGKPGEGAPRATLPTDIGLEILDSRRPMLTAPAPGRLSGGTSMYAPMTDRNETVGVIHVAADPKTQGFSRSDLDLLAGMAAPAAMMLQNANNHAEALQRDRLSYDLELAAQIQKSFLPREVLSVEGVELFAEYRAAHSVGGDFYDVFWVSPGRLGVFIGDISGKGVSGALLMARISSEMRVAALAHVEPITVLSTMNKSLVGRNQPELFFTAIYLTLDVSSGEVVLANAGHPSPYCSRADGTIREITEGAAGPVGIVDDPQFESTRFRLEDGESLVLYTDGVVEAAGPKAVLYGSDRLTRALAQASTRPSDIAEHILASVQGHLAGARANDDLTLFICQRTVGRPPSMQPRRRSGMMNRAPI
jgi:serine phosphatase RsbU (regulator of sigma subunit)